MLKRGADSVFKQSLASLEKFESTLEFLGCSHNYARIHSMRFNYEKNICRPVCGTSIFSSVV